MEVLQNIELEVLKEFRENATRLAGMEESEEEAEESEDGLEDELEESKDREYQLSEESEEVVGLGPEVEEELEMEERIETPPPPELVLDSGSEHWDLTLR